MDACHTKQYSDVCVQTSPIRSATCDSKTVITTPIPSRLKRVAYVDQAASGSCYDDSHSRRVYPRTPISRSKTQLPLNLPKQVLSPSITLEEQRRVVSLPEQLNAELLSQKLAKSLVACPRNVSMPAVIQHFPQTELAYEESPSVHVSPSVSYEDHSDPQNYAQASDFPHTSSFDSSSTSIEIIDDSLHFSVPETFLQAHYSREKDLHKDWLTWNSSPPRPIPALHGPSSLPYARCPSGAEGTIIEQPSNVPGLIWGLKDSAALKAVLERSTVEHTSKGTPSVSVATQDHSKTHGRNSCSSNAHCAQEQSITNARQDLELSRTENYVPHPERPAYSHPTPCEGSPPEQREPVKHVPSNEEFETCSPHSPDNSGGSPQTNDRAIVDSVKMGNQCEQSSDTFTQRRISEMPCSLPRILLHEDGQNGNPVYLDESPRGLIFARETLLRSNITNGPSKLRLQTKTKAQISEFDERHTDMCSPFRRCICLQNMPLTPPDSTSPLWSSGFSSLVVDEPLALLHEGIARPPVSQLRGLNLRTSEGPAGSDESLSDQLKRLILREQIGSDHGCDPTPHPTQERAGQQHHFASSRMFNMLSSKPEMPINLHDLVTQHAHGHFAAETRVTKYASAPQLTLTKPDSTATHQKSYPAGNGDGVDLLPSYRENRMGRGDVLSGMRHPKSIPLTRLLERKLAPVPEETSFVSSGSEGSVPKTRASLPPMLTSGQTEKDYDFSELRLPLKENPVEEMLTSEHEELNQSIKERRILQPVRQRKRYIKHKESTDAKSTRSRTTERRNERNDENVHVIVPPSAPRKRSRANKSNASSERSFGSQKPRCDK
ncbi:hypothetical protein ACEPAI_8010 [Sanghuangporus weigelae]